MAQVSMGQLYSSDSCYGLKWSRAFGHVWRKVEAICEERTPQITIDQIPQELWDDTVNLAFWTTVDEYYGGKIPKRVVGREPSKPVRDWAQLILAYRAIP